MTIRVVIADDHVLFRQGLRALLEKHESVDVLAEADDGRQAVALTRELVPDLILMDVAMPGLNGIEATRQIAASTPEVKILPLSMHADSRFVTQMLEAGASGYLLKDCAFEELHEAIETVLRDEPYLSPGARAGATSDRLRHASTGLAVRRSGVATGAPPLSPREREVLQLVAEGNSTKNIAEMLGVSVKTAEAHRKQIMDKLGIRNVAELTKYAIREGLTGL